MITFDICNFISIETVSKKIKIIKSNKCRLRLQEIFAEGIIYVDLKEKKTKKIERTQSILSNIAKSLHHLSCNHQSTDHQLPQCNAAAGSELLRGSNGSGNPKCVM